MTNLCFNCTNVCISHNPLQLCAFFFWYLPTDKLVEVETCSRNISDKRFDRCAVHLDNVKNPFLPTNVPFYYRHKMLIFTLKYLLFSLLHVSVHLDHPQGAHTEPTYIHTFVELISKNTLL